MNPLVQELAKQAQYNSLLEKYYLQEVHKTKIAPTKYQHIYNKKFAELIIRECIGVAVEQKQWVKDQQPTFNYDDDRWDRARIQQSERIIEKIREHFGVKE